MSLKYTEELQADIAELKKERDKFEEKLTLLSKSPFFKEHD